jgi:hypothetical protein
LSSFSVFKQQYSSRDEIEPEEKYVEELRRIYTIGNGGIADVWSDGFRSFSSDI